VYRVDKDHECATEANQMRQTSLKYAVSSHCEMDVVSTTDEDGGSVTAAENHVVNAAVSSDSRENERVYSSSLKIDSSFVPDSLAMDNFPSENPDANALKHLSVIQVKSESADTDLQLQTSDKCQWKDTSQRLVDSACVPEHEQSSHLDNVTEVASLRLTDDSNVVSILVTVFMVVITSCSAVIIVSIATSMVTSVATGARLSYQYNTRCSLFSYTQWTDTARSSVTLHRHSVLTVSVSHIVSKIQL